MILSYERLNMEIYSTFLLGVLVSIFGIIFLGICLSYLVYKIRKKHSI